MKNPLLIFCVLSIGLFLSCNCKKNRIEFREYKAVDLESYEEKYGSLYMNFEQLEKDLEELKYILSTSYAGYDLAVRNGLNLDKEFSKIKDLFNGENNIFKDDFIYSICNHLSPYFEDFHFALSFKNCTCNTLNHSDLFMSDVFIKKQGKKFIVIKSHDESIKNGDEIKCKKENLFYYPSAGEGVYRLGVISSENKDFIDVFNRDKLCKIKLLKTDLKNNNKDYDLRETEHALYVKIKSFSRMYNSDFNLDEKENINSEFVKAAKISRNKDFVIIDLRGNTGGTDIYIQEFLKDLCCENPYEADILDLLGKIESRNLISPYGVQGFLDQISGQSGISEEDIIPVKKMLEAQKQKAFRKFEKEEFKAQRKEKSVFKGKLVFIIDKKTASSSEDFINFSYKILGKNSVYLVGTNSLGLGNFGNCVDFLLPGSGIKAVVPIKDFMPFIKGVKNFYGEGKGFYPDYWSLNEDLNNTLFYVTADEKMKEILHDAL